MDHIVVVNRSSRPDSEISNPIPAFQAQVHEDFAPIWGVDAIIDFCGRNEKLSVDDWPLVVYDHTDVAGAGGYHVDQKGRVSGKVFWLDALKYGVSPTVSLTHEGLEMLADPTTRTLINLVGRYAGLQCLREVCDAVEDDALGYSRPGADGKPVRLSDFVVPAYFGEPNHGSWGAAMDFRSHLPAGALAPALTKGGYLGIYNPTTKRWSQVSDFDQSGAHSYRALRSGRTTWAAQQAA